MCRDCWAHLGFLFAYSEIVKTVNATLFSATQLFPNYKITLTGHSLGAAVGTLLAMRLRDIGYEMDVYTYGSPRVGNEALASYISHQKGRDYRVTHLADLVARLPPINREFRHTSPEYWLQPGPSWRTSFDAAEVEVCTGYADTACNAGAPWWVLDITSHLYYFVAISHCGETEPRLRFMNEPLNGTTAVNSSEAGLDQATADTLAVSVSLCFPPPPPHTPPPFHSVSAGLSQVRGVCCGGGRGTFRSSTSEADKPPGSLCTSRSRKLFDMERFEVADGNFL